MRCNQCCYDTSNNLANYCNNYWQQQSCEIPFTDIESSIQYVERNCAMLAILDEHKRYGNNYYQVSRKHNFNCEEKKLPIQLRNIPGCTAYSLPYILGVNARNKQSKSEGRCASEVPFIKYTCDSLNPKYDKYGNVAIDVRKTTCDQLKPKGQSDAVPRNLTKKWINELSNLYKKVAGTAPPRQCYCGPCMKCTCCTQVATPKTAEPKEMIATCDMVKQLLGDDDDDGDKENEKIKKVKKVKKEKTLRTGWPPSAFTYSSSPASTHSSPSVSNCDSPSDSICGAPSVCTCGLPTICTCAAPPVSICSASSVCTCGLRTVCTCAAPPVCTCSPSYSECEDQPEGFCKNEANALDDELCKLLEEYECGYKVETELKCDGDNDGGLTIEEIDRRFQLLYKPTTLQTNKRTRRSRSRRSCRRSKSPTPSQRRDVSTKYRSLRQENQLRVVPTGFQLNFGCCNQYDPCVQRYCDPYAEMSNNCANCWY